MQVKALPAALLLLIFASSLAYADPIAQGSYLVYEYSLAWRDRSVSGTLREEVLRDYEDGTIRLRIEATMNDGVLTIEKNVPEGSFRVPRLPGVSEGIITYSDENRTFTLSVEEAGSSEVSVGGRSYRVDAYRISLGIEARQGLGGGAGGRMTLSGVLKLIQGSGVIYSFEGVLRGEGAEELRSRVSLLDTNINLDEVQTSEESITGSAQLTVPVEFVQQFMSLRGPVQQQAPALSQESMRTEDLSLKALVVFAAGAAALAVAAVLPSRIGSKGSEPREVSRPHYV